ncbi:MAG: amidohydrolase family protein [Planctomycetota bacterium]
MSSHAPPEPDAQETPLRVEAACVADVVGSHAPGALLIDRSGPDPVVLARGAPGTVRSHPRAAGAETLRLESSTLIPALVNAHAHLDLTHIGPRPFDRDAGFVPWVDMIRAERVFEDAALRGSVREGLRMSRAGGVACVGDIAGVGSTAPGEELVRSGMRGVSFVEFFGLGARQATAIGAMRDVVSRVDGTERVRFGLQPHAPYSAGLGVYREAAALSGGYAFATHLAETPEEAEFVRTGGGPQRELLERLGVWDGTILDDFDSPASPVAHLRGVLSDRVLAVHLNGVSDDDLALLASSGTRVAYCPRCSDYFGRNEDFGPHRYREMLEMGIRVALGTDSIINLPDGTTRIGTLDEMAFLHARDGTDPTTLLAMATTHGAAALGFQESLFTLADGPVAGVLAVPGTSLADAIARAGEVAWIA